MAEYQYEVSGELSAGALIALSLFGLAVSVVLIVAMWRIFTKANQPGWAAIVPIYNTIVLLRIVGRPWWWLLLMLIPLVNIILVFIIYIDLARSFGKGTGFGVLMVFFPYVCILILGFSSARYLGPVAATGGQPPYPGQPYPPQQYPGGPYQQQYQGQPYQAQQYGAPQYPPAGQQYPGQQPGAAPYAPPQQQYPPQQYPGQQQYPPQ